MKTDLLSGKKGVIFGLANSMSIAWGIAKTLADSGAELILTYQNEILKKRVEPLAKELSCETLIQCDLTKDNELDNCFETIEQKFSKIDFIVHAVAFSDKNELRGKYIDTSRANFLNTMDISCYSFVNVAKKANSLMNQGSSIITLTYYGAEKVVPNYNVMGVAKAALESSVKYAAADLGRQGIRVNAISAGCIKTLAAAGIGDFKFMYNFNAENSPLGKNVDIFDVGKTALYLVSDLSTNVTGEVIYVDAGYNIMGSPKIKEGE